MISVKHQITWKTQHYNVDNPQSMYQPPSVLPPLPLTVDFLRLREQQENNLISLSQLSLVSGHCSTNGALKSSYKKMNIFVYILGRIPPTIFVSSVKWSPILQASWPWCHSMQMVCTKYSVCVECTVCLLWKKLQRIELHKYCKNTS